MDGGMEIGNCALETSRILEKVSSTSRVFSDCIASSMVTNRFRVQVGKFAFAADGNQIMRPEIDGDFLP